MTLVVDASVALKWFVTEPDTPEAEALLARGERLIAPDLIVAEVCNAVWKRYRRGEVTASHADLAAARIAGELDALTPVEALATRTMALARALSHSAYDCFYLALAEREAAPLVTADRRLIALGAAPGFEGRVISLAEASIPSQRSG